MIDNVSLAQCFALILVPNTVPQSAPTVLSGYASEADARAAGLASEPAPPVPVCIQSLKYCMGGGYMPVWRNFLIIPAPLKDCGTMQFGFDEVTGVWRRLRVDNKGQVIVSSELGK